MWAAWHGVAAVLVASALVAGVTAAAPGPPPPLQLRSQGLAGVPGSVRVLHEERPGAEYLPGSSVLRLPDGSLVLGAAAPSVQRPARLDLDASERVERQAAELAAESRRWLAAGTVPDGDPDGGPVGGRGDGADGDSGATAQLRDMAERALLDLRLLTRPDGASLAAPEGIWAYVWPRDAAFVAAAFAATGHAGEAEAVLRWLAREQRPDGTWAARSLPDGSGPPDDRPDQLDATGWVPWAVWATVEEMRRAGDRTRARALSSELAPTVARAVAAVVGRLGPDGLPPATPDYWEVAVDGPTLGTVGPLLAGLRAAGELARQNGDLATAGAAAEGVRRLEPAVRAAWPPATPTRYADGAGGVDSAVVWLAPPFGDGSLLGPTTLDRAEQALRTPSGGVRPGEEFTNPSTAWTPETAGFALAYAAMGRRADALRLLDWLAAHRTSLGALPEKVDAYGAPASVAPLGWTAATVLLALTALERPLGVPGEQEEPARPGG
ncbi:glycoside hydrolase family 15 protein [Motilibacter deserti]|uniref:Glycoside hydrolase family 15 n=1 Tax=Motilibacter deserti TaxID=2714956 RepID=A0ABX0GSS0_9ACTN|nr:glycoside hydrolase family 15 [Motilibacter deserti]NHC13948.1 glycoside hydrolase family 15 [Motilibacter deserti]